MERIHPHFTYKKRKCVRPQPTWGSSLPNQLFQDLEITFNFAYPFLPLFSLFSVLLYSLFFSFFLFHHYHFLSTFIYTLYTPPYFTVYLTDLYINYYQSYIQCWLSSFQFSVSSALVICCYNHILYNEKLFNFPWFNKTNFSDNCRIGYLF